MFVVWRVELSTSMVFKILYYANNPPYLNFDHIVLYNYIFALYPYANTNMESNQTKDHRLNLLALLGFNAFVVCRAEKNQKLY